jgi:hypothetical protein
MYSSGAYQPSASQKILSVRAARRKFLPPPPEFAPYPLEREAWPRNSARPFTNCRLIPADVLKKHCVHEPLDPRFRSAARLLQTLWREDQDRQLCRRERHAPQTRQQHLGSGGQRWRQFLDARNRPYPSETAPTGRSARFGKFACPLERANGPGSHGICEPPP